MLTIESASGWHRATVEDGAEGTLIHIYEKLHRGNGQWRPVHSDLIAAPFHHLCAELAIGLNALPPPSVSTWPTRETVRSIIK